MKHSHFIFRKKIMLHCFHIWINAWYAKGDIRNLVGFGILALIKILQQFLQLLLCIGLNQRCECTLVFLRWKIPVIQSACCRHIAGALKRKHFLSKITRRFFFTFSFIALPFPSTLSQWVWEKILFPRHLFYSRIKLFRSGPPSKDQPATINTPSMTGRGIGI